MAPAAKLTTGFFVAAAGAFAAVVIVDVWMAGPKARVSPQMTVFGGLVVGAIFTLMGTLVVGITAALLRRRLFVERQALVVAVGWGIAYPILWHWLAYIVEPWGGDSVAAAVVAWVYLLGFPLLLYWPIWHLCASRKADEHKSAL